MSYQTFLNEVEKGLPSPVYLLYSSDTFLLKEAAETVRRLVPEDDRDFNLHLFDLSGEEAVSVQQALDITNTVSFFGSRRYTLLTGNLLKITKKEIEKVKAYIASPSPSSVFIMLHSGALKRDAAEKFNIKKTISLDIREPEIPLWIKQRVKLKGVEISDEAVSCLIASSGTDLGLLASEIEKIAMIGKKRISYDDITDILAGGRLYNVFDLVNALNAGNADKVFRIYKTLRETTDDYSLIGALNWQYGRSLHRGMNSSENSLSIKIFELLRDVDIDIKSSGRDFPLEYLLIKLLRLQEGLPSAKGH